jgi:VanZ family protein
MPMKYAGRRMVGFWLYWFPVLSYMLLIFWASSCSSFSLPTPSIQHLDKFVHAVEFAILGYLLFRAVIHTPSFWLQRHALLVAIVVAVFFGLSDEIHQFFVPLRRLDMFDLAFDSLGAILGSLTALWIEIRILARKKRERKI